MGARATDPLYIVSGRMPEFAQAVAEVRRIAQEVGATLVCIDTIQKFTKSKDVGDYAQIVLSLGEIENLTQETGATFVFSHHSGHAERGNPTEAFLGSVGYGGAVDAAVLFKRREEA